MKDLSLLPLALLLGCAPHLLRGAEPERGLSLPADDGAHDDAQTEWWHFHGHLQDPSGRRYDWFLAFIRQHTDLDTLGPLPVRWFVDPFQVAYFVLSDRQDRSLLVRERHNFPDTWAAGAEVGQLDVHHDDWTAEGGPGGEIFLHAASLGRGLDLCLAPNKAISRLGDEGYLYVPPRSSTYYYSQPRMTATGTLAIGGEARPVRGSGWFKHQWGFLYDDKLAGWVWFGAQLTSGQELELGVIFDGDWNAAPGSFVAIQEQDGSLTQLDPQSVGVIERGDTWRSPQTGTVYPVSWSLAIPGRGTLELRAPVEDQELVVFPANLWAGALRVSGLFDGQSVGGDAFAEVVGLDAPFGRSLLSSGAPATRAPDRPGRPARPRLHATRSSTIAETYARRCAPCHGPSGRGDGPAAVALLPRPRDLSAAAWQRATSDAQIEQVIGEGGAAIGLSPLMPAHPELAADPSTLAALRMLLRSFELKP